MYKWSIAFLLLVSSLINKINIQETPSNYHDLKGWKLQIPGPSEVKDLKGYTSDFFHLDADKSISFDLDASETGTTSNAIYVRSELRHLANWETNTKHSLSTQTKVSCDIPDYKVTVMQVHGINRNNSDAPVLLRVALVKGDLYAFFKSDNSGVKTDKQLLQANVGNQYFKTEIQIEASKLSIKVNGKECFKKDVSYWTYLNYFKIGCYPQQNTGKFKINIKDITVS